jgi:hypothetical protein
VYSVVFYKYRCTKTVLVLSVVTIVTSSCVTLARDVKVQCRWICVWNSICTGTYSEVTEERQEVYFHYRNISRTIVSRVSEFSVPVGRR